MEAFAAWSAQRLQYSLPPFWPRSRRRQRRGSATRPPLSPAMWARSGRGGVSSSGRAQGSYHDGPGLVPGVESRTAGTDESGRLELSGVLEGTLSGTFRGDTFNGRTSGIFGECSGNGCAP